MRILDDEMPSLDEAIDSVDALVSDDAEAATGLEFGQFAGADHHAPPGLMAQHEKILGGPAFAAQPSRIAAPPGLQAVTVTPEQTPTKAALPTARAASHAEMQAERGLQPILSREEEFPALGGPQATKTRVQRPASPAVPTPKPTPSARKAASKATPPPTPAPPDDATKGNDAASKAPSTALMSPSKPRQVPYGTGDVATVAPELEASARGKVGAGDASFPPLPYPAPANSPSPVPRNTPKTLRVVSTAKGVDTPALASPVQAVAAKTLPQRPGTPSSEMVSDTASVVSASVSASRAGSPPPNRIGSAAVRSTTKSQQRKQRKDALRQETKTIAEVAKAEQEEHAPVIGRKKKQKREKPAKAASAPSENINPEPKESESEVTKRTEVKEREPKTEVVKQKVAAKDKGKGKEKDKEDKKAKKGKEVVAKASEKAAPAAANTEKRPVEPPAAEIPAPAATEGAEPPPDAFENHAYGPFSVFSDIKGSLWASAMDKLQLLKPVSSGLSRSELGPAASGPSDHKEGCKGCRGCAGKGSELRDEDFQALRAGKGIRKQFQTDGGRILVTPNGDCIRELTSDEEDAFLGLQAAIATTADHPGAFVAPRHQNATGAFSLIKGRAVPNGRPNIFPTTPAPQTLDPIGKLQREDALSYINQYVLPRLNLDSTSAGLPKGTPPLRDAAAAASLNALAPYFYGPDAAAGVGIYSNPDGAAARSMHDAGAAVAAASAAAVDLSKVSAVNHLGSGTLMSVDDAAARLAAARKETDKLEKGLNAVIKRNKRLLLGGGN